MRGIWFILLLFLWGCSTSPPSSTATLNASLKLATLISQSFQNENEVLSLFSSATRYAALIGENDSSLGHLKYFITEIILCESLTLQSETTFSDAKNCTSLVTLGGDRKFAYDSSSDYSFLADLARTDDSKFTDLMNDTSRASLVGHVIADTGKYEWGYVSYYPMVRWQGDLGVYHSRDGTTSKLGDRYLTSSPNSMQTSASQISTELLTQGSSYFKLPVPLNVSAADVQAGTSFAIDVTFNPDGFIKAFPAAAGPCPTCNLVDADGTSVRVPPLVMMALAHRSEDEVIKELYLGSLGNFDLRLELYYVKNDTSREIIGVSGETLTNGSSQSYFDEFPKIVSVSDEKGALSFHNYSGSNLISGLVRAAAVGDTTTATVNWPTSTQVTFTLKSISALE